MKRILLFVASLVASLNLLALTPTATATITLRGDVSGAYDQLILVESTTDGFTPGYENGYDVFQALNTPAIYAISGGDHFSTSMTNNLDNNPIGFIAGTDAAYTLTFSGVSGRTLKIYDKETHTETVLANDGNYPFAATPGARIDNRFVINFTSDNLDVCFKDNKLEINNNPNTAEDIVIKDAAGNPISGSPFVGTSTLIPLTSIGAKGDRFTVEFYGGARKFVIVKE